MIRQRDDNLRASRRRKRRGSVILLVLVTILLMVLLGASMMQNARMQRLSFAEGCSGGDIKEAIRAVVDMVTKASTEDLVDANGNFFVSTNVPDPDTGIETGCDEPYDYPWTNTAEMVVRAEGKPVGTVVTPNGEEHPNVVGGKLDDMWLAASEPVFDTNFDGVVNGSDGAPYWSQITSLTGVYLGYKEDFPANPGSFILDLDPADGLPVEYAVDYSGATPLEIASHSNGGTPTGPVQGLLFDPDVSAVNDIEFLVDADGDGIRDSRWEWVEMAQIDCTIYITAVRIIDLASKVNMNTATVLTDTNGQYVNSDAPRWTSPSELDLGRFIVARTGTLAGGEVANMLDWREPGASIPMTVAQRLSLWEDTGRFFPVMAGPPLVASVPDAGALYQSGAGDLFNSTNNMGDELELLHRNGLNNDRETLAVEGDGVTPSTVYGLPVFLRSTVPESDYNSFDETVLPYNIATPEPSRSYAFFRWEPRKHLTTTSGTAVFSQREDRPPNQLALRMNPNPGNLDVNNYLSFDALRNRIASIYASVTPAVGVVDHFASVADFATQLVVNLRDYYDSDNTLTRFDDFVGLEPLPMLVEAYSQAVYTGTATQPDPTGAPDVWDITWTRQDTEEVGFAIEIRNPFKKRVHLPDVELFVNGASWGTLDSLAGQEWLAWEEVLILYRDSTGGPENSVLTNASAQAFCEAGFDCIEKDMARTWPKVDETQTVDVELRARVTTVNAGGPATTAFATEPYSIISLNGFEASVDDNGVALPGLSLPNPIDPSLQDHSYGQRFAIGNADGLDMLTVQVSANVSPTFTAGDIYPVTPKYQGDGSGPPPSVVPDTGTGQFRVWSKSGKPNGKLVSGSWDGWEGQIIFSQSSQHPTQDRLDQPAEIAHLFIHGPNPTAATARQQTIAGAWQEAETNGGAGSADQLPDFMIDLDDAAPHVGSGNYDVPHAVLLLSELAPLREDIERNIPPNQPEPVIVPGLINLNTVPLHLLDEILPIQDGAIGTVVRQAIINRIRAARERPNRNTAQYPGIAFLGELYSPGLDLLNNNHEGLSKVLVSLPGTTGNDTQQVEGIEVDFLDAEDAAGNDDLDDDIYDGREEEVMPLKWLENIATTRSDVFAAYFVVRGYDSADFSLGPIESARVIVVFQRGRIDPNTGDVLADTRILAVQRLE